MIVSAELMVALSEYEGSPTWREALAWTPEMVWLPRAMAKARVALPVPLEFVAEMVELGFPAVVGVPEMSPEVVLTVRPAGRPLAP